MARGIELVTGEEHVLVVVASTMRVRLVGMFFDLNKCFLLPSAMRGIRKIKTEYDVHPGCNLLVVGHTDTSGGASENLTLSLERADAVAAFLTDAVGAWESYFAASKPETKRWGTREVQRMLTVLPDGEVSYYQGEPNGVEDGKHSAAVRAFQGAQGLTVDGIAGPLTRRALIREYMALDGTTLPRGTTLTTHGCGENFPADDTGDGVRDPDNRRVEIFFFDGPIKPPPASKVSPAGATDYPQWLAQVEETIDVSDHDDDGDSLMIRLHDENSTPMTDVQFCVAISGQPNITDTSADGFVTVAMPPVCPERITVSWGGPRGDGTYLFSRTLIPDCGAGNRSQQSRAKLSNLGYPSATDEEFAAAARAFQYDYQIREDGLVQGDLPPASRAILDDIYDGELDATRPQPTDTGTDPADENDEPPPLTLSMECEL